jgi:AcrR family transcriptional regulator
MRADALRNREQIVSAAQVLFISHGPDVPMEDVARAAGVGVGTLYRRFPDRCSLLTAVATNVLDTLAGKLREARAAEPTAWDALVHYLVDWAEFRLGLLHDPLCESMPDRVADDADVRQSQLTWLDQLEDLIRDAQGEGVLRPDVGLPEIAQFMNMLVLRLEPSDTTTKLLQVMIDGLRAG